MRAIGADSTASGTPLPAWTPLWRAVRCRPSGRTAELVPDHGWLAKVLLSCTRGGQMVRKRDCRRGGRRRRGRNYRGARFRERLSAGRGMGTIRRAKMSAGETHTTSPSAAGPASPDSTSLCARRDRARAGPVRLALAAFSATTCASSDPASIAQSVVTVAWPGVALVGGVHRCDLAGQVVVPRPRRQLVEAHRHGHLRAHARGRRSLSARFLLCSFYSATGVLA